MSQKFGCFEKTPYLCSRKTGFSAVGSAHVWGARGRWFESSNPDTKARESKDSLAFCFCKLELSAPHTCKALHSKVHRHLVLCSYRLVSNLSWLPLFGHLSQYANCLILKLLTKVCAIAPIVIKASAAVIITFFIPIYLSFC